jgi:hypothetical protein
MEKAQIAKRKLTFINGAFMIQGGDGEIHPLKAPTAFLLMSWDLGPTLSHVHLDYVLDSPTLGCERENLWPRKDEQKVSLLLGSPRTYAFVSFHILMET